MVRRRIVRAAAMAAVLATAAGCGGDGKRSTSVTERVGSVRFSLLARTARPADALPPAVGTSAGADIGVRVSTARRAYSGLSGVSTWLVTASDALCMVRVSNAVRGRGKQTSLNCVPQAQAVHGTLVATLTGLPGYGRGTLIQGFVPDGVDSVSVKSAGGGVTSVPVSDNAYAVAVLRPRVVAFRRPNGAPERVPVFYPQ